MLQIIKIKKKHEVEEAKSQSSRQVSIVNLQ